MMHVRNKGEHGNAVVEFLIVPLVLLPLLMVIPHAVGIEQTRVHLAAATRDVERAAALTDGLTKAKLIGLTRVLLADSLTGAHTKASVTHSAAGWHVAMAVQISGLLPGTSVVLRDEVTVQP